MGQAPEKRPEKVIRYENAKTVLKELLEEEACFTLKDLAVKGCDLMEIGYPPGKELGKLLDRLLEAVMDGLCPNEKEALLRLAKEQQDG